MIYFTSDLHLGHNREFVFKSRGFDNIQNHDAAIIQRWNDIITNEDVIYILGDLMLNDNENGIKCLKQLKGHKYFVRGNHDTDTRIDLYMDEQGANIAFLGDAATLKYKGYHFYLSHYPTLCSNFDDDKFLKQRTINLCGHSHTTNAFSDWERYNSAIYHCELDAHNCYPISLDSIIQEMQIHWAK